MSTLYTFWDNMIPYRTESVHFFGPINSATKAWTLKPYYLGTWTRRVRGWGFDEGFIGLGSFKT